MRLQLEITQKDIARLQRQYASACESPDKRYRPRLMERDWIAREILRELPSGATSQKGQWAVDATLAPIVEGALLKVRATLAAWKATSQFVAVTCWGADVRIGCLD